MDYKRSMHTPVQAQHENPDIASLATIGMRIRKAVADGYNTGNKDNNSAYLNNGLQNPYYVEGYGTSTDNRRVPLPDHMSQPPALSNSGSTIDSCSNVSEWESRYQNNNRIVTLPQPSGTANKLKRRLDDDESDPAPSLDTMKARYGELSFDEDF